MKKPSLLDDEVLHYLREEWEDSLKTYDNGLWLTTRAFQLKLQERGILTTWPTLNIRMNRLFYKGDVEVIKTSNGDCWKPAEDSFKI
jgi:hypothetical protein